MKDDNFIHPFDATRVALTGSNLIEASAGTGKTYSIAILTLRLVLENKIPIQQILMVTFTKAAVAELETRIRQFMRLALKISQGTAVSDDIITAIVSASVKETANGPVETERLLKEAVLFLDETAILTIHGFCQRVLTEFAFETKQIFGPEILTDVKSIITERVNVFWRKHITTLDTNLLYELINVGLTRTGIIKMMENALSGKVMILLSELPAGFLSGSNQEQIYASIKVLDDEIRLKRNEILGYITTNIGTLRAITEQNAHAKRNMAHLLEEPSSFLEEIINKRDKVYVQKIYSELLSAYEKMEVVTDQKERMVKTVLNQVYNFAIQVISAETEMYKQQHNLLGFDDMINRLHEAVVSNRNESLIGSLRTKYKAAFIDEFQDTDKLQYEIFSQVFGSGSVIFYIGDPKQSIYAWRKADIFTYFKAVTEVDNCFGMNINYRSSKRFIGSMNHFFLPETDFDTFSFSAEANAIKYIRVGFPAESAKGELCKDGQPDIPITIFENPNNPSISETVVAQVIQLLSGNSYTIKDKEGSRKVRPSDIGILVRKNKQAHTIKKLLSKYCIPAVTIDDTKLLQSAEAVCLLYLLEAVMDIGAPGINKALLSPLTGFKTADILAMDDELALNRFKNYQYLWEQEGVYVMITRFIADYNVKQVLLNESASEGERIITNTLQLMELLHKMQTQKQFSSLELANWLKRGIEGMEVEGDEFEQRVESDEEALKIVTIHKSKGLEYNIVFAPFLDLMANTDFEFVTFRDPDSGNYLFSERSLLDNTQLNHSVTQLDQENRRLIYVAVTRAVYKCYLNKNNYKGFSESAITPFIKAIRDNKPSLIEFGQAPSLPVNFKYSTGTDQVKPAYLQATAFQLLEVNWRRLSYTYLDTGHIGQVKGSMGRRPGKYDEFVFKELRRGAATGNFMHYIFERIDFADQAHWEDVIAAALKRFVPNPPSGYTNGLVELLHHVTEAVISLDNLEISLHKLPLNKRLNELEFDFTVDPFDPDVFSKVAARAVPVRVRYDQELEGIMNGKIDLFFEHAGKYFILDWKSNFLGERLEDYSKENIRLAMTESNYHLQYLVYTIAVKKYLQLRLPGFDYHQHFGGVIYLFLRGIRRGTDNGIFAYKPEAGMINELEQLLQAGQHSSDPV